jgi:type II secretion system protein J
MNRKRFNQAPSNRCGRLIKEQCGRGQDSGFTLIEILVASAIASIILMIVYTSYQSIVKSIKRATGHAEFYENVNLAISKIDMDISNTYYTKYNKKIAFVCEEISGNNRLSFVTVSHNDYIFSGNLTKSFPISDVKEVGYYLKADKTTQGLYQLIKREKVHYGEDPSAHADSGTENIILVNVVSLKFEFQRGNDWDGAWDSRKNNMYPRAVKTNMVVKNYQEKDEKFEFISLVNMREFK